MRIAIIRREKTYNEFPDCNWKDEQQDDSNENSHSDKLRDKNIQL